MYFFILILQTIIITTKWPFPFWKQPHHFRDATKMVTSHPRLHPDIGAGNIRRAMVTSRRTSFLPHPL